MSNIKSIKDLVNTAYGYQMEQNFNLIKRGDQLNTNKRPFNLEFLSNMLKYFKDDEKYEECIVIQEFINLMNKHDENYNVI